MLPPSELKLIRSFEHGGTITCPFSTVSSAFYHHATANPRALALRDLSCSPPRDLSYRELAHRAQCLAERLRDLGVGPGQRVPLVVKRGVDMVVGIWAVLSAGAQYVPLDGGVVPDSTVRLVVEQSGGCAVALCVASTEHRLVGVREGLRAVRIEDNSRGQSEGASTGVFMDLAKPESGCYVIYTSGTTGTPKGVDVTHRNVANLVCQAPGSLDIGPGDKVGSLLNISFDMAAWEIFACLCNGGALVMRGSQWEPALEQINILICTPTILSKYQPSRFAQIKVVATAGEPSTQHLADLWATHATYWNCCGPTETTIVNTMSRHIVGQPLSIGKPTPNNAVYILSADDDLTRVPVGSPGCMWAGGHGVSRGYVGLEGRTREAYVPDELAGDGSSMYKTGDLGSWRADGSIDILGRADDQVKVKGFRVELDGVAATISSFPGVTRATALLVDGRIVGFASPAHHDAASVIEFTKRSQPYYAVPSSMVLLPSLPATPNGKIDKQALRVMAARPIDLFPEVPSASEQSSNNGSSSSGSSSSGISSSGRSNSSNSSDSDSDSEHNDEKKNAAAAVIVDPESLVETHSLSSATTNTITTATSLGEKRAGEDSSSEDEEKADALSSDIPGKNQDQPLRGLRHIVFITYRRLFSLIWLVNVGALVALLLMADGSRWLGLLVAANLTACVLIRQELVINALYAVTCSVPKSFPLWIRSRCAKIYHLGGVHSGAGICATAWLLISTVRSTIEMWSSSGQQKQPGTNNPKALAALVLSWLLCLLTCSLVGFAWPGFRKRFHNHFERIHRFVGWTTLAVFWARTVLAIDAERAATTELGLAVVRSPVFWLLLVATLSVASSWFFLRRVPVEAEVLSDHAVRLHFDYTLPVNGSFTRVSRRPLLEWHSFATIPQPAKPADGNGRGGYSLVISNAGDWTRSCIRNPPRELWVRGLPTCGVMRVATLFRRVVVIATGSGIGPLLGHINAPSCPTQLIWSTPNPEATFGRAIIDSIRRSIPDAVIHDTRAQGRPDLVKMGFNMARGSGAEAVIIIANEKITKKVVYGLQTRGIPAYGAIWDS